VLEPASGAVLCSDTASVPDAWYVDATFYEVFVRSYQDSNGDGIGDFDGLTSRLDYLNDGDPSTATDLGVTALWLMPFNPSPSYHGYDVTDYRSVATDYGGMASFRRFLVEAKKRGIRVVMDLVMNHTSTMHPWFVKGKRGPQHPTHDFYLFRDTPLRWGQPWNANATTWHPIGPRYFYGLFWGGMPDLNYRNPEVRREMLDVAAWWLRQGVDGFRLDAARYLYENGAEKQADQPETHQFWRSLRTVADKVSEASVLIGEVWTDLVRTATYFGSGRELHMLFGFDRASAIRSSASDGSVNALQAALCAELTNRPPAGWFGSFATNHDMDRVATRLGQSASLERLALVAKLLFTLPGSPFIYYGQELGLRNGPGVGDREKRMPMRWTTASVAGFTTSDTAWATDDLNADVAPVEMQLKQDDSLLAIYRQLIALRATVPALRRGSTWVVNLSGRTDVLAFLRVLPGELVLVLANASESSTEVRLPIAQLGLADTTFRTLMGEQLNPHDPIQIGPAGFLLWQADF